MATALVLLLSGRPVRPSVGMTGEVTLQRKVLRIGGVEQKVLAAHRAGLSEVVLPARDDADLDDVPGAVLGELRVTLASEVGQVLDVAFRSDADVAAAWRGRSFPVVRRHPIGRRSRPGDPYGRR